jgi:hypothetical protein
METFIIPYNLTYITASAITIIIEKFLSRKLSARCWLGSGRGIGSDWCVGVKRTGKIQKKVVFPGWETEVGLNDGWEFRVEEFKPFETGSWG